MEDKLDILRHSTSHVMAHAVNDLFDNVKFAIGPSIEDGFYYDFDCDFSFTDKDLEKIENRMHEIIKSDIPFVHSFMPKADAINFFREKSQDYKCELIQEIEDQEISIYTSGDFVDLCKGPHIVSTKEIKAFKLLSVAGAYWRGNEKNKMLQRIYGTAFEDKKALQAHLFKLEEAKKRDHRILGKKMDLFSFQDEAPGFPFYHKNGVILYNTLIDYWREEHLYENYIEVKTPIIMREELWKRSGHYDHYKEHMYFTKIEEKSFAVKPMNCPGGLLIYKSKKHSYREFPIKMAELGLVHRHELSGVLHGLFRVKCFTIDDGHIFCLEEQIANEVSNTIQLILKIYRTFDFSDISMELSTRPDDSMGSDEIWEKATDGLIQALKMNNIVYKVNAGDGAFYGPKIDFHIKDSIGRSWQCGTVQLDFSMPERFELEYVGSDGNIHRPVMIHRAAFGSVERFIGILIEHYAGAFPLWMSPEQVRIMSISDKFESYAETIYNNLRDKGIRCDLDTRGEKIGYKIREAESARVNYMIVVGEKEMNEKIVAVRARGKRNLGTMQCDEFYELLKQEINEKK